MDAHGFAWPEGLDPDTWSGYRPQEPDCERAFTDISPVEIRNAAASLPNGLNNEELLRAILTLFGHKRLTTNYRKYISKAITF